METEKKKTWNRKGGRPKKSIRRDEQLALMCTLIERKVIEYKARMSGVSISQFLRELALNRKVDDRKSLPKEVLLELGRLNHMAANINQIAKKRNREQTFNAIERAEWMILAEEVKKITDLIKNHLK